MLINQMKQGARRRGYEWSLSREQVRSLTSTSCYYCGAEPSRVMTRYGHKGYLHNGIDRQNNDLGYTKDNCVPCCTYCNFMKGTKSVQELKSWIIRTYKHFACE